MARFGCLAAARVSYQFGGGVWKDNPSLPIIQTLVQIFAKEQTIMNSLEVSAPSETLNADIDSHRKRFNQYLTEQGVQLDSGIFSCENNHASYGEDVINSLGQHFVYRPQPIVLGLGQSALFTRRVHLIPYKEYTPEPE